MAKKISRPTTFTRLQRIWILLTILTNGISVLILEILGTRILAPFYGSTIFVWSSLITVTLGFLALGYYLGGKIRGNLTALLSIVLLLTAASMISLIKFEQPILAFTEQFGLQYGPLVSSLLIFSPFFFLSGIISPLIVRTRINQSEDPGMAVGNTFFLSTAGSVAGALAAGFYLIPNFSLTAIFISIAVWINMLGITGSIFFRHTANAKLGIVLFIAFITIPKNIAPTKDVVKILAQQQSFFGDVKVIDYYDYKCLYVNGSGQTCMDNKGHSDGFFQRFISSELPKFNLNSKSRILLLGLGGGGTLDLLPTDIPIDIVELDPQIVKTATQHFGFDASRPGLTLTIDDARHFLNQVPPGTYDLILENIALGNSIPSYILTQESFAAMKNALKSNGILVAHIGTHQIKEDNLFNQSVYSSSASLFEYNLAISSQKDMVANLILYHSDRPMAFAFSGEHYPANMEIDSNLIATDDRNPLDHYYLSNALSQRQNVLPLGQEIFYTK
jgi:spermidine synthase